MKIYLADYIMRERLKYFDLYIKNNLQSYFYIEKEKYKTDFKKWFIFL
jgi:hypothetical protein